jgi:hypothetical protein
MPKVIILGSSNAVPSKDHENTHLVIIGEERTILSYGWNRQVWISTT